MWGGLPCSFPESPRGSAPHWPSLKPWLRRARCLPGDPCPPARSAPLVVWVWGRWCGASCPGPLPGLTAQQCRRTERHCDSLIRRSAVEALKHRAQREQGSKETAGSKRQWSKERTEAARARSAARQRQQRSTDTAQQGLAQAQRSGATTSARPKAERSRATACAREEERGAGVAARRAPFPSGEGGR